MDHPKHLYEPELVARWSDRLRRFEADELARRREVRRQAQRTDRPGAADPQGRAA
ncbi:MAG: hypothetical protein AB7O50_13945 [Pseudolabrys sp.]